MKFFNSHISPKTILNILLGIAIFGIVFILISVNRINGLLNTDLGFNKDSVIVIKTQDSKLVLSDSMVFSSDLPGFIVKNLIEVKTNNKKEDIELAHQFVSDTYFDLFNYIKLIEDPDLFLNQGNAQFVYINESAAKELGIYHIDDAVGTKILTSNNHELVVCGVVKDYCNLCIKPGNQAKIFQLANEHLSYAFYDKALLSLNKNKNDIRTETVTFQEKIQNRYKIIEDGIYSIFFFINAIILLIGIGYIGNKYTTKREKELFKILGIGIHVLTLIISKTYFYLIAIMGFVVGPLAFIIQKFWLELYVNRINFGLIDLFIILSIVFLTFYVVCCPKRKLEKQLKCNSIQHNQI